jgi:hypothetical protein
VGGLHHAADGVVGVGEVARPLPGLVGRGGGDHRTAAVLPEGEQDVVGHRGVERAQHGGDVDVVQGRQEGGRLGRGEPHHLSGDRVSVHGTSGQGKEA